MNHGKGPFGNGFKGIIFDMDGVIFDSESVWRDATFEVNPQFGIEFDDAYRQSLCGMDEKSIRSRISSDFPHADVDGYRDAVISEVNGRLLSGIPPRPGFLEFLEVCRAEGLRIGLATSSDPGRAMTMFEADGLDPDILFDATAFGTEVSESKPDPEIFLLASSRMGLDPGSCLVLEDSLNGLKGAFDGGFHPMMLVDLVEPDGWVASKGIPVFHDFEGLLRLGRFVHRPKEYDVGKRGPSHSVFMGYSDPTFSITARLDVTDLFDRCKSKHRSFFIEFLHMVSVASNGVENFRLRLMDGKPVIFDVIDPSYVVIRDDDTICTSSVTFTPDRDGFFERVRADVDACKSPDHEPSFSGNRRLDLLYVSCLPWIDFVSVKNPYDLKSIDECSIPRITWGRVVDDGGRRRLTVDVSAHHALMDGYHIASFFNGLQDLLDGFIGDPSD